ncbi:MAG: cardiolipin synthase ClsB [Thiobacillus sp.]|nr:cardiolipin synthase ClsB [Thiobacillus sp.]
MTRRSVWKRVFRSVEPVPGNHIRLLAGGAEFFPALIAACDAAHAEIHLETYIFNADASGEAVYAALVRAARRGVQVRLLIDGIGARDFPAGWRSRLQQAGAVVLVYRPLLAGWHFKPASLRRLHRKVAVIDASIAFVGGINLIDDYEPVRLPWPRLDFSVEVRGPLLARIHANVRRLWRLVALTRFRRPLRDAGIEPGWPTDGRTRAAFIVRDNVAHRRDIERAYLAALALARHEIFIANAYFLPGRRFRKLLARAAARGVRVRLLVQGHTDHPFFQLAARALYRELLAAGVEIAEYHAGELHAKVAVVDGHWATVGSSNIDPFSLLLAREANVLVDDPAFAQNLRARLDAACAGAEKLDPAGWQRRPWWRRQLSEAAYAAVRVALGMLGAGRWA